MKNCQKETLIQNFGENSFSFNNKLPCLTPAFYYYWGSMSGQVSILAALEMPWTKLLKFKLKSVWGWLLDYKTEKKTDPVGYELVFFFLGEKLAKTQHIFLKIDYFVTNFVFQNNCQIATENCFFCHIHVYYLHI
jgi:hypothetical protein